MPNWCNNIVVVKHKNKEALDRVEKAFDKGELCQEFIPIPEELMNTKAPNHDNKNNKSTRLRLVHGYSNWYDFCVNEWGTKWDVGSEGSCIKGDDRITLYFDSAWSPPVGLYRKLLDEGYDIVAYYFESGMMFAGMFSADGDEYYEVHSIDQVRADLPKELDEMMGITEMLLEWEEMEKQ